MGNKQSVGNDVGEYRRGKFIGLEETERVENPTAYRESKAEVRSPPNKQRKSIHKSIWQLIDTKGDTYLIIRPVDFSSGLGRHSDAGKETNI